ncbi:hypothetical protein D3C73_1439980 [compost metagenome]
MVSDNYSVIFKVHNSGEKDRGNEQIDGHIITKLPFGGKTLNKAKKRPDKRNFG